MREAAVMNLSRRDVVFEFTEACGFPKHTMVDGLRFDQSLPC